MFLLPYAIAIIIGVVYEQLYIYYQFDKASPLMAATYYLVDIPFFFLVAHYALPYAMKSGNKASKLFAMFLLSFSVFILSQNIIDWIWIWTKEGSTGHYSVSYIKSCWRAFYLSAFSFSYYWAMRGIKREREAGELQLRNQQLYTDYLKSAIKPHLLLNTLNIVYSRIKDKDPIAAKMILCLVRLMQYAIRPSSEEILLEEELLQVKNYITLNELRLGEQFALTRSIVVDEFTKKCKMQSIIVVNLVENVFNHGIVTNADEPAILNITGKDGRLLVTTRNRKRKVPNEEGYGIGLSYMRHILAIHYPGRHILDIKQDEEYYEIQLAINL